MDAFVLVLWTGSLIFLLDGCSGVLLPYHSIQLDSQYLVLVLDMDSPSSAMVHQRDSCYGLSVLDMDSSSSAMVHQRLDGLHHT